MIVINGRFLTQKITGVQRFAHEIIRELDRIVKPNEIKILVPRDIIYDEIRYKNVEIIKCGKLTGHLWEQIELPFYVKKLKGRLLNLCNTAPIINPGIITIHDIQTKVHPEFFNKKFAMWYNFMHKINVKKAQKIITVSEFSKKEIIKYYNIDDNKIEVIYNGWQHMERIIADESILDRLNIKNREYILGVSSINPNKNFKYILELAKLHPEYKFIVVGKKNDKIFSDTNLEKLTNLIWTGYITDEEIKALYSKARVFIFPSFYEGFGIPPLEALACGCKQVIASNTSCLPEIFETYILYLNPKEILKLDLNLINNKKNLNKVLSKFSWERSAEKMIDIILKKKHKNNKIELIG